MDKKFDYEEALAELERIAVKVEDPQTGIGDIDVCIKRTKELVEACRAYLREARDGMDKIR